MTTAGFAQGNAGMVKARPRAEVRVAYTGCRLGLPMVDVAERATH